MHAFILGLLLFIRVVGLSMKRKVHSRKDKHYKREVHLIKSFAIIGRHTNGKPEIRLALSR